MAAAPCRAARVDTVSSATPSRQDASTERAARALVVGEVLWDVFPDAARLAARRLTAPLAMGAISDVTGQIASGFWLATSLAALLCAGLLVNWITSQQSSV